MLFATRRAFGRVRIGLARARIGVRDGLAGRVLHDVAPGVRSAVRKRRSVTGEASSAVLQLRPS